MQVTSHRLASGMLEHHRSRAAMHYKMQFELRSFCCPRLILMEFLEFDDDVIIFSLVVLAEACLVVVLGKEDTWNLKAL